MIPCRAMVFVGALLVARAVGAATESSPQLVAATAAHSVVKIYGAGGLPVGSNAYMGLGAGYPYATIPQPAGYPVSSNAYHGWGTSA